MFWGLGYVGWWDFVVCGCIRSWFKWVVFVLLVLIFFWVCSVVVYLVVDIFCVVMCLFCFYLGLGGFLFWVIVYGLVVVCLCLCVGISVLGFGWLE